MTPERRFPVPATEHSDGGETPGARADREAQERADDAEDWRRQEELDFGELGGEA
jgi:hypothetical protein